MANALTSAALLTRPARRAAVSPVRALLLAVAAVVLVTTPVVLLAPGDIALAVDDVAQLGATLTAVAVLSATAHRGAGSQRIVSAAMAAALLMLALGLALLAVAPGDQATAGEPAGVWLLAAAAVFATVLVRTWFDGMPRDRLLPVGLESAIVFAAAATALVAVSATLVDPRGSELARSLTLVETIAVAAGPVGVALALLDRGERPGMWGPYALLAGLALGGMAWLGWQMQVIGGSTESVSAFDPLVSFGVLLVAWSGVTWRDRPSGQLRFPGFTRSLTEGFPIVATAACTAFALIAGSGAAGGLVHLGAATVTGLTLARQVVLIRSERRTHRAERDAARRLSLASERRAAVLASLGHIEAAATPEATAGDACRRALKLEGVEWAVVMALEIDGGFRVLAELGPLPPLPAGHRRPRARSAYLAEHASRGPWIESVGEFPDEHLLAMRQAGIEHVASAPLTAGERLLGVISLGGGGEAGPGAVEERLVAAREFGAVVGALLAPGLDRQAAADAARATVARVISEGAFYPVFQPIVRLADRRVVGFEALTRFSDGARPDIRFEEAAAAGMGLELEMATLAAAMREATALPTGAYVSLNVSAELACHPSGVVAALGGVGRDLVLEVTEHAAVESYAVLRDVLAAFGEQARIAVDDAGAGYAGLRHILEIRPDLVKLDISLVRGVASDAAKRAMVGAMSSFARETGCALVAEGVEDEADAEALQALGVALGQGWLFGRPQRAPLLP
ncbi:MAG: EAL domain-containing protein [Chloroflexota bacterium]